MESQRKASLSVHPLGPSWFLTSILLATALVLPGLTLDSLLCNYCPLQLKGKPCPNVTSQCLPDEHCSSSRGRYGFLHVLSAQGCVAAKLCGSHEIVSFCGVRFNVSHTCCCKDQCNHKPTPDASLKKLLGMTKVKQDYINFEKFSNVVAEEPYDSCENYTLSRTSTLPATAS